MENDQGGTDETFTVIIVNGVPTIELNYPENPRAGDAILLDATSCTDPEGAELTYLWDLDWGVDSDGDGDGRNDVDATDAQTLLCLLYTSPSPRDLSTSRMPSSA